MAIFYNITSWSEKLNFQTGGTRNKVIVENPEDDGLYYFKTSLLREKKDYKHEFWSEIIASELGTLLGFDMLRYDIALNGNEIGCISKSMNTEGESKLTEGMGYLTGYDTTYNPEDKSSKSQYTFQLIQSSLEYFQLGKFIQNIIEIIVLDSIIGNGDRHQENWGILTNYNDVIKSLQDIAKQAKKGLGSRLLFSLMAITTKAKRQDVEAIVENIHLYMPGEFSQIYDSGSCLGRELDDEKINLMLKDVNMLEAYIRRGTSEIHWNGEKLNHFDLIKNILFEYKNDVIQIIKRIQKNSDNQRIKQIVYSIDENLPNELEVHKLPEHRKEFIFKLITLRLQNLFGILE